MFDVIADNLLIIIVTCKPSKGMPKSEFAFSGLSVKNRWAVPINRAVRTCSSVQEWYFMPLTYTLNKG